MMAVVVDKIVRKCHKIGRAHQLVVFGEQDSFIRDLLSKLCSVLSTFFFPDMLVDLRQSLDGLRKLISLSRDENVGFAARSQLHSMSEKPSDLPTDICNVTLLAKTLIQDICNYILTTQNSSFR